MSNDSEVLRVSRLNPGEAYSRSEYIPAGSIDTIDIEAARRRLNRNLSPVKARVLKKYDIKLVLYTTFAFTEDYGIIVTGTLVRPPTDDNDI